MNIAKNLMMVLVSTVAVFTSGCAGMSSRSREYGAIPKWDGTVELYDRARWNMKERERMPNGCLVPVWQSEGNYDRQSRVIIPRTHYVEMVEDRGQYGDWSRVGWNSGAGGRTRPVQYHGGAQAPQFPSIGSIGGGFTTPYRSR